MMINQLLKFPISGSKETRCGSGLRRMLCLAALLVFCVAEAWSLDEAFSYDLYVGGVKVKTANASNITGDNIKAFDSNVNGGKPLVYYLGLENTLYLYNVSISRTGNDHHAIESNVPGLKIILYGNNELTARDASAIRLNADTEIRTKHPNYSDRGTTTIYGGSEDAVYAGKDDYDRSPRITINNASLLIISESSAFDAVTGGDSKLIIKNSYITAECTEDKSGDCYALFDYKSLTIENSSVGLQGYSQAIKNLTELTLGAGMYIETPSYGFFSSSSKTIIDGSSKAAKQVIFKMGTPINSTTFPDENFRNWVLGQKCGSDGYITPPEMREYTFIDLLGKGIASLQGIEYFTALKELNCSNNKLTTLNLSKNTALTDLVCMNNNLTNLYVSNNTALRELFCTGNSLATLNVSKNTALQLLYCSGNNLTTLNVSNNTALTKLDCGINKLTTLDLSNNKALTELNCSDNKLTTLKLNSGMTINEVYCDGNKLRGSSVTTLINSLPSTTTGGTLYFYKNETSTGNSMTLAQVKAAKAKKWNVLMYDGKDWVDYVGSDVIAVINETNFPDEKFRNWVLAQSYGKDGYLSDDEIANVKVINVSDKDIASLKGIEFFTALINLYCEYNNLTTLDVSKNTALTKLLCYGNGIRGEGMTTLVNSLPVIPEGESKGELYVLFSETPAGNEITARQVAVAKDKGWRCLDPASGYEYEGLPDGDVNADGSVDNKDVEDLSDFIMGRLPDADKWFFDANGDGEVNAADIVYVINILNK